MEGSEAWSEDRDRQQSTAAVYAESLMNLALVDPPRWGWTAAGTIADLLPPHERSRRRCTSVAYRKRKRKRTPSASRQEKDLSTSSLKVAPEASSATSEVEKSGTETIAESTQNVSLEELISEDVNAATTMNKAIHPPSNNTIARSIIAPESSSKDDGIAGNKFHNVRASSADSNELQQSGSTSSFLPANFKSVADAPMKEIEQETGSMGEVETAAESSKPQPLPTLKLLGFKSKYLGMTVAKASATENVTKSEIAQKGASNRRSTYECQVEALSSDGALDMYSYHRGREGLEPRDPESGDLRCPLPASDTNYNYDAPRLSCSVTIEFPLHDDSPDNNLAVYSETLSWDLLDPTTPSPLIFANGIAIEFGLKYGQMLDLAFSIEAQIESHLQQTLSYFPPISTEDPTGMERQNAGSSIQTHRYGQVTQIAPGGTILAPKERQRVAPVIRTVVRPPSSTASTTTKKKDRTKVMVDIFDDDIDDKYLQEVRRRSRAESVREIAMKCKSGVVGLLERNNNFICHICHKKCNVTYSFACGLTNHTYCELHCQSRLEGTFNAELPVSPYCPVCTLLCRCSKCVRKLKAVAGIFQDAMESQGTTLEGTQFENILSTCRTVVGNTKGVRLSAGVRMRNSDVSLERVETPPTTKASSGKASNVRLKRVGTGLGVEHLQLLVPKPPLSEFPREIYGSLELEPGTPEDYLRVYSARGSYLSDDFPSVWSEQQIKAGDLDSVSVSNGQLVEDGNVDFCQICRNHGNLLCCDFCPRAFHVDCLDDGGHSISEERWECITCKSEKADMPEDQVDVKKSMDVISSSFGAKVEIDMDSKEIEALSAIHAMILRLIEYDFGYMFAVPVDVEAVPGYKETVEKPMDLGTICEKLSSGGYVDTLSDEITWESVLVTVLQDVELVWHNCFLFNFDGSAIYRMAAVQRRRALAIQKRSFDHLLSDDVKSEVNRFVRSCEVARGQLNAATSSSSTGNETEKALRSQRPKGKHKITVKVAKPSVNRPVAIFDQVSGRIVKIYSSMKSASHAAHSLISLGHRCEWPSTQDLVKQVVAKSASDPSIFLFGYRWLMLDELREGKVTFHEPLITGIQLQHQGGVYTFLSVDEAVSFPLLDKNERIDNLRMQLMTLEPGGEWIHIGGVMWRSLAPPGIKSRSGSPSELDDPQSTPVEGGTEDCSSTMEASFLASSAIIKEDLITKRKLVGFGSVEDAFLDWLQTADFSPSFPPLEAKTLDNFKIYFLDGDRNIDGLVWKAPPIPNAESNVTARDNTQLPVSTINGIALSPLIRSCDKKRPQEIDPIDGENQYEERQRKRDDDGHLTTGCSAINSAVENTRGPPLLGIQLFKQHSPRSDQPMKPENGQLSRSSKDVPAAASS